MFLVNAFKGTETVIVMNIVVILHFFIHYSSVELIVFISLGGIGCGKPHVICGEQICKCELDI